MKPQEFALLKTHALLEQLGQTNDLSLQELELAAQERAIAALERLRQLKLTFPEPTQGVQLTGQGPSGRSYRVIRSIAGRGVQQSNRVAMQVFTTICIEEDDLLWYHVSFVRLDKKIPSYEDLTFIKEKFFPFTWAIQVFPRPTEHVSSHDKCLHLWTCLERNILPDFRKFGTI